MPFQAEDIGIAYVLTFVNRSKGSKVSLLYQTYFTSVYSSWLISTFFFTNPCFVLLICDWPFVLFCIALINAVCVTLTSNVIRITEQLPPATVGKSEGKVFINNLNVDIFLTKTHWFATGGLYSPPPRAVGGTFQYGWMCFISLLLDCWTKTPAHTIIKLGRARTIFNKPQIGFVWKKKVIHT